MAETMDAADIFVFSFSSDGRCPAFIDEEYTQLTEICEWEPSNFHSIQVCQWFGVTSESFSFSDGMMASQITEELMVWSDRCHLAPAKRSASSGEGQRASQEESSASR